MAKSKPFVMAQDKPFFDPVDTKVNFPKLESEILDFWCKEGIVEKYLTRNKNSKKIFSFLDGPITANNPMGVHHAWGRTYKDLWQRFYNMRGYKQRFQNGFDCQGLWVEVEVEKELGLKSKKDIENLVSGDIKASIAKFVNLCKERVFKYAKIQTEQSKRLGYFMDWDNSYYTLSDDNNYMIWYFLKRCADNDLIYKGRDSVAWCPRCGTAISQHEILTEDYKEVLHDAIYVSYPITGRKDEYLLIWTTTAWTLPANVAVAVDPKLDYVLGLDQSGKKYYVLKAVAKKLGFEIIKSVKGRDLLGWTYTSPFDHLDRVKKTLSGYLHRAVSSDDRILPISGEEGTGIVHIAPGAGSEDFALGKKENLPVIEVIDEEANYLDALDYFSYKNAKREPQLIINFLKDKGAILKEEKYKHRYPVCWRCKTELVWRVVDEWYIAMDKSIANSKQTLRERMMDVAKKIRWIPEFGLERELDWLENMHDWLISKKRYWGLALPIWECKNCGYFEVIGSKEDLKKRAISGWSKFEGHSPHRPWVDEVMIRCSKCTTLTERISDVGNPWLDAGIVTFSTVSNDNKSSPLYWTNRNKWEKWFPSKFITESFPGQFKNWFYSLIATSTVLEGRNPFETVLGFATLLAQDGRAMHKSLGNAIEFNEGAEAIGVDVMRWMYARQNPAENLLFGYKVADEIRRRFHLKLWNVYNFFVTYANLEGWRLSDKSKIKYPKSNHVLDRWILSRLIQTIDNVENRLNDFNAYEASSTIDLFVDDLSNWYIRRSRQRISPISRSKKDKDTFFKTTHFVLNTLMKILAIFVPYISENMFKNLSKEKSVHLSVWPKLDRRINHNLLKEMIIVREVVEKAHAQRKVKGIAVRQPLAKLSIINYQLTNQDLIQLIKDELNVKNIEFKVGKGEIKVKLDTNITPELEEEAKTRELIRNIQEERKKMGINLTQKVIVRNPWLPESKYLTQRLKLVTFTERVEKGKFKVEKHG